MKKIHISKLWSDARKMSYGKFVETCFVTLKNYLPEKLADADKNLYLSEIKPVRSNDQNRYYWVIIAYLEEQTGSDKITLHEFFRQKFLFYDIVYPLHRLRSEVCAFSRYKSTTELNTKQFTDYIEKICVFMADFGIEIPQPKDPNFNDFLEHYKNYL